MLLSLGIHVTNPSNTLGDNEASIMRATVPDVLLKKKHVTLSYLHPGKFCIGGNLTNTYMRYIWGGSAQLDLRGVLTIIVCMETYGKQ
jgi:hypothetical protein